MIKATDIAKLRAKTDLPMMECKKALEEAGGNESKAIELLKKRGINRAAKKAEREVKTGVIESYVHDQKIGVLVEVLAETDFVTRNKDFQSFVHDVALNIAAFDPKYISIEDVPQEVIKKEKSDLLSNDDLKGKPKEIMDKIVDGRMKNFYRQVCLLEQPFVKDEKQTINELLTALIAKIGEKIVISRFVRYQLGN